MYITLKTKILSLFGGSDRSQIVKKNIAGSFLIKGLGILTSLLLVPFTLHLLDQEKYGIWMTIFSIVGWFNMMDVGIGNGFRNKFAEAVALNNKALAKEYVQTLYSSMAIIGFVFAVIFSIINPFLNWYKILNLNENFNENISLIVLLVFVLFCVQLYTKNISTIFLSLQKTTLSNSLGLYSNVLSLLLIFVFQTLNAVSLLSIAISFMASPIIINLIFTYINFKNVFSIYKPKLFALPQKKYLKDLIGLGLKFFFIQITTIVMFTSANIIITQLYSPSEVTPYNIAFRLFSSVQGVFVIIITPFWSAFTEANSRNDYKWIKSSISKLVKVWGTFSLTMILFWILSPYVFKIWVGVDVIIPFALSLQFTIYTIIMTWISIFVYYINGVGKIKLQLYIAIFQLILNIPLAIFLSKYLGFGVSGIIMATNINLLIPAILIPIQYKKLINHKANGIWFK